jgi:CubicO group peptidase (beta-lactamase class C family)
MRSFLVACKGQLIWERYFGGHQALSLNNLRSATKSFTSTLVGIALHQGDLPGLDAPMLPLLKRYLPDNTAPLLEQVTLRHLLTMTAGFEWKTGKKLGEAYIHRFHRSRSWVRFILDLPVRQESFGTFQYRSTDSHLLSVLLSECTGVDAFTYARRYLFGPLGIEHVSWMSGPEGHTSGHVGLYLTSRDMLKFGMCCLDQGRWEGRQLIPSAWLTQSMSKQTDGYPAFGDYGYQWWTGKINGAEYACAHGHGGQQIYIIPALSAVVVFTADSKVSRWKQPRPLLEEYIIPALSAAGT